MKEYAVKLTKAENATLQAIYEAKGEALRKSWGVDTFEDFLRLMVMHGADNIESL